MAAVMARVGKWLAWLAIPIFVGLVTYMVATVLREEPARRWTFALIAFGVALLVLVIVLLVRWLRKRSSDQRLESGIAVGGGRVGHKGEVDALRKAWRESVQALKTSGVAGGGKRSLGALPWFVIIGAPASGKSTLLRQSGIDFPVGDAAIRGLQGTRNCDWWFSNVGIFLDTAGRYISDESAEEWAQFLDLVRKHRLGSPVNGVIVALPAPDVLQRGEADLDLEARRIRARLDELIDHLGVNFPVWVVVTKVDLVGGFAEFFGGADAQTRNQMMGWTAEQAEGARFDRGMFERRFGAMTQRLRDVRPHLLGAAKLRDRPLAYAFPDELAAVEEPLGRMLSRIFEPNVYQDTPFFRGLFITSATQQGTPLQKAAARIREMLGASSVPADPEQALVAHAYFVTDLMHERIVRDQSMTWTTPREMERGKTKRLGINLLGASAGVLLFLTSLAFGLKASRELDLVAASVEQTSGGGVERADALWRAAAATSDDNYRNLGLSQQKSLKLDLEQKQREVFTSAVAGSALDGFRADIETADVGGGFADVVASYGAFRELRSAFERTATATPPAEGAPPAAAPPPGRAPEGFFAKSEIAAAAARRDRFVKDGVLGEKAGAEHPALFLDVAYRNQGAFASLRERADEIDALFRRRLAEYVAGAATAVETLERNKEEQRTYYDGRRRAFEEACREVLGRLDGRATDSGELRDLLDYLAGAAAGESGKAGGAAPATTPQGRLASIGPSVAALEASVPRLVTKEELEALPGWAKVKRLLAPADAATGAGGPNAAGGGGDGAAALQTALAGVRTELLRLAEEHDAGNWVPRPWPMKKDIPAAIDWIEKEVSEREGTWQSRVTPHLVVLEGTAGKEKVPDEARWGRAVLWIEPSLHGSRLVDAFVTGEQSGSFARLARAVVQRRTSSEAIGVEKLWQDLEELLPVADRAESDDPARYVAVDVRDRAADAIVTQFRVCVDRAQTYWDSRTERLPQYTGSSPWTFLRQWAEPDGAMAKLAVEVQQEFGAAWAAQERMAKTDAARAAWKETKRLRDRYAFFWDGFDRLQNAIRRLHAHANDRGSAGLPDLLADLSAAGDRPVWDPAAILPEGGSDVTNSRTRTDLVKAIVDAEDQVATRVATHFNQRWEDVRRELAAASGERDEKAYEEAMKRMAPLVTDLRVLFGEGLDRRPGGRLQVTPGFRAVRTSIGARGREVRTESAGMTLELVCDAVPTGADVERFPVLEIEYKQEGRADQTNAWEPNQRTPFVVHWTPGKGVALTLYMANEQRTNRRVYLQWNGPDCLLDALRDGGKSTQVTWKGRDGSTAKFTVVPSDSGLYGRLVRGEKAETAGTVDLPATAVEVLRRP